MPALRGKSSSQKPSSRKPGILACLLTTATLLIICTLPEAAQAQRISLPDSPSASPARPQRVSLESDSFYLVAGERTWIELRFHVAPGMHINSHTPHDELLIATTLKVDSSPKYQVFQAEYPAGTPLQLNIGAGETLSAYQGEFRVRLLIAAEKGAASLAGTLHYQACDSASCFPPRDLPVRIALNAR